MYHSSAFRSGVGKLRLFEPGTYGTKVKDLFVFFKLLAKIVSRKFFRPHFTFPTNSHFSPSCCLDHLKWNAGAADVLLILGKCIQWCGVMWELVFYDVALGHPHHTNIILLIYRKSSTKTSRMSINPRAGRITPTSQVRRWPKRRSLRNWKFKGPRGSDQNNNLHLLWHNTPKTYRKALKH